MQTQRFILLGIAMLMTMALTVSAAPAAATSQTEDVYIVQRSDTLFSIARRYGTTVDALVRLNNIRNPNVIYAGQRIYLPVVVTPTLGEIAPWPTPAQNIVVWSPIADSGQYSAFEVYGVGHAFEGNIIVQLLDQDGETLMQRTPIAGTLGEHRFFSTRLRFRVDDEQDGTLKVFDEDPETGEPTTEIEIPLRLFPHQRIIDVEQPTPMQRICSPIIVSGVSDTFEAHVSVDLRAADGSLIQETSAMGGTLGAFDEYWVSIEHSVTEDTPLFVDVYTPDARDGRPLAHTRVPVILQAEAKCK